MIQIFPCKQFSRPLDPHKSPKITHFRQKMTKLDYSRIEQIHEPAITSEIHLRILVTLVIPPTVCHPTTPRHKIPDLPSDYPYCPIPPTQCAQSPPQGEKIPISLPTTQIAPSPNTVCLITTSRHTIPYIPSDHPNHSIPPTQCAQSPPQGTKFPIFLHRIFASSLILPHIPTLNQVINSFSYYAIHQNASTHLVMLESICLTFFCS